MMRVAAAVSAFSLLTSAMFCPVRGQGGSGVSRFRGQLVREGNGPSVARVVVRARQFGQTLTNDNGYFEFNLPAGTSQIEIVDVGLSDPKWSVRYPKGAIPVVRDSTIVTSIIVGPSFESLMERVFSAQREALEANLVASGAKQDEIRQVLDSLRVQFAARAQIEAESLRVEETRSMERAREFAPIAEVLKTYVNEAKDLRNAFRLAGEFALTSGKAYDALKSAIVEYNSAYERLNATGPGFEKTIRTLWRSETLGAECRGVLDYALGEIHHVHILPLNETLETINRIRLKQIQGNAAKQAQNEVLATVALAVRELDPRLEELQRRIDHLLSDLGDA